MKKTVGMFAALIIALAMTGVAFASWSQIITISGTVETGELVVGFVDIMDDDDGTDPGYTKDVGDTVVSLETVKGQHLEDDLYETAVITITDAYPSYSVTVTVYVANGGTIPVNAYGITDPVITGELAPWVEITGYDINLPWPGGYPQIDPCDEVSAWVTIHILQWVDLNQDGLETPEEICPMNSTATITTTIEFVQWNEP